MRSQSATSRRPRFEPLENRRLLAVDLAQITGLVRNDLSGDGVTTVVAPSVQVELFRDNGDGIFGSADTSVGTQTTSGSGAYTFTGLTAGGYFVRVNPGPSQQTRVGQNVTGLVTISAGEAMGSTLTIDDFSTAQSVTASSAGPTDAGAADGANAGFGGVRDLRARVFGGSGTVALTSNFVGTGVLNISSDSDIEGIVNVVWDGTDGSATAVNASGLGGVDVTQSGANLGLLLNVTADNKPGATVTIRAYSGAGNVSTATVTIADQDGSLNGDAAETQTVPFTSFTTTSGTGANFASLGALELELDYTSASLRGLDARIDLAGAYGVTTKTAPTLSVYNRMSLGDLVWIDRNNDGVFNPSDGDYGVDGVTVTLCTAVDANNDGIAESETFLSSVVTSGGGRYLFSNLFPDDYVVKVAATGPLSGLTNQTGNDTAGMPPDADDPTAAGTETDKGFRATADVRSKVVTLVGDSEPTNDQPTGVSIADGNANSNLTVDFGFFGYDVVVSKQLATSVTVASPGDTLTYTVTVRNDGPSNAPGVVLSDLLGAQLAFASGSGSTGSTPLTVTANGQTVTSTIGTMIPGQSATFTITTTVNPNASGVIRNTASVAVGTFESVATNNAQSVDTPLAQALIAFSKRSYLASGLRAR